MIWAVILSAGESRRMGVQKLLLPFGETTIIESVVRTALDSSVDGVLVVLGADREAIKERLRPYPVSQVVNTRYREGMLSSIQVGVGALPPSARAAMVMLGDQPSVNSVITDELIAAYRETRKGIVIPVYGGRRGHPAVFDTKYKKEILGLAPEAGLRQLNRDHPEDILEVEVPYEAVLKDIDTPEDYEEEADKG
jgi:molybdenum cofactor cytidylyltransferase